MGDLEILKFAQVVGLARGQSCLSIPLWLQSDIYNSYLNSPIYCRCACCTCVHRSYIVNLRPGIIRFLSLVELHILPFIAVQIKLFGLENVTNLTNE